MEGLYTWISARTTWMNRVMVYTPMDIDLLPPLYLIYAENLIDSGKVHSTVRQRWLAGDEFIISTMEDVANIAVEGQKALLDKDYAKLAAFMNHNLT
ncbi:hypothetical protein RND71_019740 [Anisodus tanguticus]|uniref:Uncharacterized protein n=1 Tax=Anisodus tanguticus TaxID=243964 RepID=A0AAE1V8Q9_9SOLA|nr:hypothetical protein RND71_019740 [Anisodus tanguticus]